MFRFYLSIQDINNGALNTKQAMPQKDVTSDGNASFSMGRQIFTQSYPATQLTNSQYNEKKWYRNRDASQVTANRRNNQIGSGSSNVTGNILSFTTYKDVNTVNDALTRVRAGGSVAPPKKAANKNNALVPSFSPAVPPYNIRGIKYPVLYHC